MPLLPPLPDKDTPRVTPIPLVDCAVCGTSLPNSHAFNIIISVGVPGHPDVQPFQCPHEEHWACSIDHWLQVSHACLDEHIHAILQDIHANLPAGSSLDPAPVAAPAPPPVIPAPAPDIAVEDVFAHLMKELR